MSLSSVLQPIHTFDSLRGRNDEELGYNYLNQKQILCSDLRYNKDIHASTHFQ